MNSLERTDKSRSNQSSSPFRSLSLRSQTFSLVQVFCSHLKGNTYLFWHSLSLFLTCFTFMNLNVFHPVFVSSGFILHRLTMNIKKHSRPSSLSSSLSLCYLFTFKHDVLKSFKIREVNNINGLGERARRKAR